MSNEDLGDLLLMQAEGYLGVSGCVYWSGKLAATLDVDSSDASLSWQRLCKTGRLEKVVYCQIHNGKRICYRLPRSEPEAGQESSAQDYIPASQRMRPAAEVFAEREAERAREAEEAKTRPRLVLSKEAAELYAFLNRPKSSYGKEST